MRKNIYNIKLGEMVKVDKSEFTRVPGGWIVLCNKDYVGHNANHVFVRYHNEFQEECANKN